MKYRIISSVVAVALVLSCSVKEDRAGCACLLVLDMSPCSHAPDNIRIDLETSGERIEQDFIPGQDAPFYEYPVTKGVCSLSAYLCPRELTGDADAISVEPGENCPEIYASRSVFEVTGETAEHQVVLHKQFTLVTLELEGSAWDRSDCSIKVRGSVAGLSISDMKPIEGRFYYELPDGERAFRLPRQTSKSAGMLTMELCIPGGSPQVLELGKYFSDAHYDWEREDLEDIVVKIDDSETVIETGCSDWVIHTDEIIVI